jgi:hypothetical protein
MQDKFFCRHEVTTVDTATSGAYGVLMLVSLGQVLSTPVVGCLTLC